MAKSKASSGIAPVGWNTITPRIVAQDARGLVGFVQYVFGAAGEFAYDRPSIMVIGNSRLMIGESGARDPKSAFLYVYVQDADLSYRRALERGATSIEAPFDTPYGDRRCMVEDPWGNRWQIAVHRMERSPQQFKSSRDVIIRTRAWSDAVKYYETVLRLPVTHRGSSIVGFEAGGFCLYVESGPDHGPVFEFLVPDVAAARAHLLAAGCSLVEEDPSLPRCYVKDPYGVTYNIGHDPNRK